jgi:hypothetical protein
MDSDSGMMAELFMQEEANAIAKRQQQLFLLANLLRLHQHLLASARLVVAVRGLGRRPTRTDYFTNNATHTPKDFRRCFRMNKDMFMKVVFGVREYDIYYGDPACHCMM